MNDTIGTVDSSPIRSPPQPHWKTIDHDAVGRADAQQVEQHGLQRYEHRAEHQHQQHERQREHGADEDGQAVGDAAADVATVRRGPPTWARAGLSPSAVGSTSARSRATVSAVASSCGPVVGNDDAGSRRRARVDVAARREAMPGSAATAPATRSTTPASPASVDGDDQRAVGARPEALGDEVVGPALGPVLGQRAVVGHADPQAEHGQPARQQQRGRADRVRHRMPVDVPDPAPPAPSRADRVRRPASRRSPSRSTQGRRGRGRPAAASPTRAP